MGEFAAGAYRSPGVAEGYQFTVRGNPTVRRFARQADGATPRQLLPDEEFTVRSRPKG